MAKRKGDNTAQFLGRLTLDPLAHIDWVGTVLLPGLAFFMQWPLFGWAKPVPVNPGNFKDPVRDMFWVAFAGPLSNLFLALVGTFLLVVAFAFNFDSVAGSQPFLGMINLFIVINLFLGFFNLLPLHPLDGGKIWGRFLPYGLNSFLEKNQMMLSFGLVAFFLLGGFFILATPVYWVHGHLLNVVGIVVTLVS